MASSHRSSAHRSRGASWTGGAAAAAAGYAAGSSRASQAASEEASSEISPAPSERSGATHSSADAHSVVVRPHGLSQVGGGRGCREREMHGVQLPTRPDTRAPRHPHCRLTHPCRPPTFRSSCDARRPACSRAARAPALPAPAATLWFQRWVGMRVPSRELLIAGHAAAAAAAAADAWPAHPLPAAASRRARSGPAARPPEPPGPHLVGAC